jgi:predicted lipoprotein with Yx(FWY)xxD motif
MLKTILLTTAVALTCVSGMALADGPAKVVSGDKGKMLTDAKGMTLYTFDKDSGMKSACNGDCAKAWPPLMASASDKKVGEFTIITRDDGGMQWAHEGKPLYTWSKDMKAGDATGDGFKDVWHIAKP